MKQVYFEIQNLGLKTLSGDPNCWFYSRLPLVLKNPAAGRTFWHAAHATLAASAHPETPSQNPIAMLNFAKEFGDLVVNLPPLLNDQHRVGYQG